MLLLVYGWFDMGLWMVYSGFTLGLWMVYYGYRFMVGLLQVYCWFTMGVWIDYYKFMDGLLRVSKWFTMVEPGLWLPSGLRFRGLRFLRPAGRHGLWRAGGGSDGLGWVAGLLDGGGARLGHGARGGLGPGCVKEPGKVLSDYAWLLPFEECMPDFQFAEMNILYFPLVLKGIHHYWTYFQFSQANGSNSKVGSFLEVCQRGPKAVPSHQFGATCEPERGVPVSLTPRSTNMVPTREMVPFKGTSSKNQDAFLSQVRYKWRVGSPNLDGLVSSMAHNPCCNPPKRWFLSP